MFEELPQLVNGNEALVRRGRFVNATFLIEADDESYVVRISDGAVTAMTRGPFVQPHWTFALRASREAWAKFLSPDPPPGFTDVFALQKKKLLRIEGDLHPFMANLLYFKDVLASLRQREGA